MASEFIWGTASSAYQTEGATTWDGKGPSIWDAFCKKKGAIALGHSGRVATEFYLRYKDDLALMQAMGIENFRFSVSWPRVLPEGTGFINQKGIGFYDRLVDACLEKNITPWITLYHWDLPQFLELKGGWTNRDVINWFAEYSSLMLKKLGDRVNNWMVLNEPVVFTGAGYFLGVHAPGKKGVKNFLPAVHHTALAQAEGVRIIRDVIPNANIGTTFSCSQISPYSSSELDLNAVTRVDALLNRLFVEPLLGKGYPLDALPFLSRIEEYYKDGDEQRLKAIPDFIGIQNYTREVVRHSRWTPYMKAKIINARDRKVKHTVMNWEVHPPSLYEMIKKFNAYPEVKNIIVTENGAAFHDQLLEDSVHDVERTQFLKECIEQVEKAKEEGCKIGGYFVWSFTDNFEWSEGYFPRFGIVYVDYPTQRRIIKTSGKFYSSILSNKKHSVTPSIEEGML
jgi:beta-glucosidase